MNFVAIDSVFQVLYVVDVSYTCWGALYITVFENDMTIIVGLFLPYRFRQCDFDVSKAQVLGQSLKFTTKLHSIE